MKRFFTIFLIIALSIIVYRTVQARFESIDNKVILSDMSFANSSLLTDIKVYFRLVSNAQKENSQITLVKTSSGLQLYKLQKYNGGHPVQGFYIFDRENNAMESLSNIDKLIDSVDNGHITDSEAIMLLGNFKINLHLFNKLYADNSPESKMEEYAKIFNEGNDSRQFQIIKYRESIDRILEQWPKTEHQILALTIGDSSSIIKDFHFLDSISKNEIVIWGIKSGIYKHSFVFEGTAIKSVQTEYLGLLGNERTFSL